MAPMLVNAEDGFEALRLFKIAVFGGLISLGLLALVFISLPTSLFADGAASPLITWAVQWWPKIETDYAFLLQKNPNYAGKYVVFNVLAAVTAAVFLILLVPPLLYFVKKGRQPIPEKFRTLWFLFGLPLAVLFIAWTNLILPTPFETAGGFSTRIPTWEMGLLYSALFWGVMQMLVVGTVVYLAKLVGSSMR